MSLGAGSRYTGRPGWGSLDHQTVSAAAGIFRRSLTVDRAVCHPDTDRAADTSQFGL